MVYILLFLLLTYLCIKAFWDYQNKKTSPNNNSFLNLDKVEDDYEINYQERYEGIVKVLIICTYDSHKFDFIEYKRNYSFRALSEDISFEFDSKIFKILVHHKILTVNVRSMIEELKLKLDMISDEEWFFTSIDFDNDKRWTEINSLADSILNSLNISSRTFDFENYIPK